MVPVPIDEPLDLNVTVLPVNVPVPVTVAVNVTDSPTVILDWLKATDTDCTSGDVIVNVTAVLVTSSQLAVMLSVPTLVGVYVIDTVLPVCIVPVPIDEPFLLKVTVLPTILPVPLTVAVMSTD